MAEAGGSHALVVDEEATLGSEPARLHSHRADDRRRDHRHPGGHRHPALRQRSGAGADRPGPGRLDGASLEPAGGALSVLTSVAVNQQSQSAGPFMAQIPAPPANWTTYTYAANTASGTFNISASGDNVPVSLP